MKRVLSLMFLASTAMAQVTPADENTKSDIRYNLNESGSHYVKMTFTNQAWFRFNESNPGTTVLGDPKGTTFDIGLRRTRMQLFGQITDGLFFYTQFGMNNFNKLNAFPAYNTNGTLSNRKIGAFFHDALGEYEVYRKGTSFVRFGGGLTILNGLSRFSQPGIATIMTMDVPLFAQATVDQTDQFSRKLTAYSRGQIGPVNYRLGVSDPFPVETSGLVPPPIGLNSTFAQRKASKQFQALLIYNILDTEDNTTPGYMAGTYLGKKEIFNIEAGIISQKNATWRTEGSDTLYNNMTLWSVAAYLDIPLNNQKAFSAYLGYFSTDYGKGYLRYNGVMNPATATSRTIAGVSGNHGNAFPTFGTGSVIYAQAGYKLKEGLLGRKGTLMPYASLQYADYDRIQDGMDVYSAGINWLIKGHNGKFTLNWENRPLYKPGSVANELSKDGRRSSFTLQYQVSI
ncbi:hypothetical protein [Dyadobacter sandarakinus]|uniref:Short chain amide porin n=1 Tax=Dyadobacter sandarakinus TaxID=2747268 RepID=A0ABX7I7Z8_9BACT|nr:hypothetical protein [Dyadobacter sandarakinus]QRR02214.1 hypothetical protein HWI92_15545 [Dyadobacter sandarakinus]